MSKETIIKLDRVSKVYKLYENDRKRLFSLIFKKIKHKENKAVSNVSFSVKKGESIALLGKNGAGKSTILKLITQVTYPTEGSVFVNGRVSALLELTSGFEHEFTGRENIFLKAIIMGIPYSEIKSLEQDIISFADLGDYIDQPVRTYSSGMIARLGFSINVNIKPEIFIVDEALSVGDEAFKKKCIEKVKTIINQKDVTLLFVTHSTNTAKEFCDRGIVLEKGKILFDGDIDRAIKKYNNTIDK